MADGSRFLDSIGLLYAVDADDKGRDDDTDLAVQKDTVRIQEHVKNPG